MIQFYRNLENHLKGGNKGNDAKRFRKPQKDKQRKNVNHDTVANLYTTLGIGSLVDYCV
jgi:hypothetical protein